MITSLTPEQEALIPVIRDKWKKIALDTSPTDQQKTETAIDNLYKSANLKPPKIVWFDNLMDACLWLEEMSDSDLSTVPVEWTYPCNVDGLLERDLYTTVELKLKNNYYTFFSENIYQLLASISEEYLLDREWFYFQHILGYYPIKLYDSAIIANYYDLAGIKYSGTRQNWEEIVKNLGFGLWWSLHDLAVVTTKPSVIKLDDNLKLHAEGKPALEYEKESVITGEKFRLYAYHGNILPEKYGSVSSKDWQAQWLSEETDSKLRWILAKEIGFDRLCQEFPVREIRTWKKHNFFENFFEKCTLVNVKSDGWGVFFLKVILSSNKKTYFYLLPEDITFKRQAEIWVKSTIYSTPSLSQLENLLSNH